MKILVVQLLRLGDILMCAPIVSGLRQKYKDAEIHFLAFRQFSQVQDLFDEDVVWHWIDRDELQSLIGDPETSIVHAYDIFKTRLSSISGIEFDCVYNLTQTKLSGWVCAGLKSKKIVGLHFDSRGEARFGSPWFQYLNEHQARGTGEIFHYLDVFRFGCELERQSSDWNFRRVPVETIPRPFILIQPLTSDGKKNYPLTQWRRTIEIFRMTNPEYRVVVLSSPKEEAQLQAGFSGIDGVRVKNCSLAEALSLMDAASLLVTGDTSIKHLSCASLIPVLEISIGSSDYRQTGIYKTGSYILQGRATCAPCPHSLPCSQPEHVCALQVVPEALAVGMHLLLRRGNPRVTAEFGSQVQWLETYISPMGFWMAKDLTSATADWELMRCIEKSTWKFLLQRELTNPLAPFGTEGLLIRQTFLERFSDSALSQFQDHLEFLESETAATDQSVGVLLNSMQRLLQHPLDASHQNECMESVREFCEREGETARPIVNLVASLDEGFWPRRDQKVVSLTPIRRLQTHLDEIVSRTQIKLRLIRSLKSQFKE